MELYLLIGSKRGMISLHELISREEGLVRRYSSFKKYFKTKFRNRILDYIRKQKVKNEDMIKNLWRSRWA